MNTLAASMSFEAVYAIPVEVQDPKETARQLSPILQRPVEELEARLTRQRAIEWLKLRLTPAEADAVRQLDLPGIGVQERPLRYYPNGTLAAQILGFAGIDNQGLEGIERQFDEYLKGKTGWSSRKGTLRGGRSPQALKGESSLPTVLISYSPSTR